MGDLEEYRERMRKEAAADDVCLKEENERQRGLLHDCYGALIWCSGSGDFGPDGIACEGFDKVVRPLLAVLSVEYATPTSAEVEVERINAD